MQYKLIMHWNVVSRVGVTSIRGGMCWNKSSSEVVKTISELTMISTETADTQQGSRSAVGY